MSIKQNKRNGCAAIIVTHNSQSTIEPAIDSLFSQTDPFDRVIIIDSGSAEIEYLQRLNKRYAFKLVVQPNIGFCAANNLGVDFCCENDRYIMFVNPDVFIPCDFLERSFEFMEKSENQSIGIVGPLLKKFDPYKQEPTDQYDSTGILRTWYGRWYDRDQGKKVSSALLKEVEDVPAVCGALMFCRKAALQEVLLREREVFDESFFMYKEDIDLGQRMITKGWRICIEPSITAYHCRGWQGRYAMPYRLRVHSARNEFRINKRYRGVSYLYSGLKYFLVRYFGF